MLTGVVLLGAGVLNASENGFCKHTSRSFCDGLRGSWFGGRVFRGVSIN